LLSRTSAAQSVGAERGHGQTCRDNDRAGPATKHQTPTPILGGESGFFPAVQAHGRSNTPFVRANLRAMAWRELHSSSPDTLGAISDERRNGR
jgi:hypothetical protein